MKLKKAIALFTMLAIVLGCVGCSKKEETSSDADSTKKVEQDTVKVTKEPVKEDKEEKVKEDTITVMIPPITNTYPEKINTYAADFNKLYPNLKLEIIETAWDNHTQKLSTMAMAGEAPDIAEVSYSTIGSLVELGVAINIKDYMDPERIKDYDQNALDYMTLEGTTYGLPLYITIQAIGANKEKLAAAGVDINKVQTSGWTYDEFLKAIEKGTTKDCFGFVFASSAVTATDYLNIFGVCSGITNPFTKNLKYSYTSKNTLMLLKAVEDMSASGFIPNYGVDASQRMVMCQTGKAMIFGKAMPLFEGNIKKNNSALEKKDGTAVEGSIPMDYVFLPVPTMEGIKESCFGTVDGFVALKNANTNDEHLKNVMLALDYLCSGDRAAATDAELYLDCVCQSGRDVMSKYMIEGRDKDNLACAAREISLVVAPPTGVTAEMGSKATNLMNEFIAPKFQALLAGECTAQEMYDELCEKAFDLFGKDNCETGMIPQ